MPSKSETLVDNLICPCCAGEITEDETTYITGHITAFFEDEKYITFKELQRKNYKWACNKCFSAKNALKATPLLQLYCSELPYLAYINEAITCSNCKKSFTFTAADQQFNFEILKHWIQSIPRLCTACYTPTSDAVPLSDKISKQLTMLDNLSQFELLEIAAYYNSHNRPENAKKFVVLARSI